MKTLPLVAMLTVTFTHTAFAEQIQVRDQQSSVDCQYLTVNVRTGELALSFEANTNQWSFARTFDGQYQLVNLSPEYAGRKVTLCNTTNALVLSQNAPSLKFDRIETPEGKLQYRVVAEGVGTSFFLSVDEATKQVILSAGGALTFVEK